MQDNLSPLQSLQLIQSMIDKTKDNLSENRFYFLLWGWLTFAAFIGQFLLKVAFAYRHHYIVWLVVVVGVLASVVHGRRRGRATGVRTYMGDSMRILWTGMGISFFVLSVIISYSDEGWGYSYPFFILLYGLGTFVSGQLLHFRPLVIGGIINWCLACAAPFFHFDYQLLFAAAAIVCSYIIPGYLLSSSKVNHGRKTNF